MTPSSVADPHPYQWLGNAWRCIRCDVQIRNQDCPYNVSLTERADTEGQHHCGPLVLGQCCKTCCSTCNPPAKADDAPARRRVVSEMCACGARLVLSRTGYGTFPDDPTTHAWAGCVTYRDRVARDKARDAVEVGLSEAGRTVGGAS